MNDKNQDSPESNQPYWVNNRTARKLWGAYQRLLAGHPEKVSKTARLPLSLVASEAGYQRSTLSRKCFPDLCEMIEKSANQKPGRTMHSMYKAKERAAHNLRKQLKLEREQNQKLINQLANMQLKMIEMASIMDVMKRQLQSSSVVAIQTGNPGKP